MPTCPRCATVEADARALSARSFFFNDTATTEIYTLSLHDALPICRFNTSITHAYSIVIGSKHITLNATDNNTVRSEDGSAGMPRPISYAVFCLKKKKTSNTQDFVRSHTVASSFGVPCGYIDHIRSA